MAYKVRLFKINSNHKNLRTDVIDGRSESLPAIGWPFRLVGKGLEFGNRFVETTPIIEITSIDKTFLFTTRNSVYALLILEEIKEEETT
jgi:hypothetical protein